MKIVLLLPLTVLLTISGCVTKNSKTLGMPAKNRFLEETSDAEQLGPPRKVLPTQVFFVSVPFTIIIEDRELLRQRIEREMGLTNGLALFNKETRTLYVPYAKEGSEEEFDILGRRMPSLESLGHELWHLPELGGWWHIQPPRRLQKEKP